MEKVVKNVPASEHFLGHSEVNLEIVKGPITLEYFFETEKLAGFAFKIAEEVQLNADRRMWTDEFRLELFNDGFETIVVTILGGTGNDDEFDVYEDALELFDFNKVKAECQKQAALNPQLDVTKEYEKYLQERGE